MTNLDFQSQLPILTSEQYQQHFADNFSVALQSGEHQYVQGLGVAEELVGVIAKKLEYKKGTIYGTIVFEDCGTLALPFINPHRPNYATPEIHKDAARSISKTIGHNKSLPRWTLYIWKNVGELAFTGYVYIELNNYKDEEIKAEKDKVHEHAVKNLLTMLPDLEIYMPAEDYANGQYKNVRTGTYIRTI